MCQITDFINLPCSINLTELMPHFEKGLYRISRVEDLNKINVRRYTELYKKEKMIKTKRVVFDDSNLDDFNFIKERLRLSKRDTWILILSFIEMNPLIFNTNKALSYVNCK